MFSKQSVLFQILVEEGIRLRYLLLFECLFCDVKHVLDVGALSGVFKIKKNLLGGKLLLGITFLGLWILLLVLHENSEANH